MTDRMAVMEAVLECQSCKLHTGCTAPVPFAGPTPAPIAVVGDAPGSSEDTEGRPFVGPAGDLMRDHLRQVGLDPESLFLCNTVSCFGQRTPNSDEVDACRGNKLAQLRLSEARYVLVLGTVALHGFRSDLSLGQARGRPFQPASLATAVCMATYHPAAGLRNRLYEREMHADLERFASLVVAEDWHSFIGDTCASCEAEAVWVDDEGIASCTTHAPPAYATQTALVAQDLTEARLRLMERKT